MPGAAEAGPFTWGACTPACPVDGAPAPVPGLAGVGGFTLAPCGSACEVTDAGFTEGEAGWALAAPISPAGTVAVVSFARSSGPCSA